MTTMMIMSLLALIPVSHRIKVVPEMQKVQMSSMVCIIYISITRNFLTCNQGGLVRKILDTKTKLDGKSSEDIKSGAEKTPRDKSAAKREIEALRESIQILCRSTNPLAKTMDYMQEDVDSMNKELDMWKKENKKYSLLLEEELR